MKKKTLEANRAVRFVREAIGQTQEQFATLLGVSLDTVRSWELGRNKLKPSQAHRIQMATGAASASLLNGKADVLSVAQTPYDKRYYDLWIAQVFPSNELRAKNLCEDALDSIFILYSAAAKSDSRNKNRLPALHGSLLEWIVDNYEKFGLSRQVETVLKTRKVKRSLELLYGQWREPQNDELRKFYNFKDDATKNDKAKVTCEVEFIPEWFVGGNMGGSIKL